MKGKNKTIAIRGNYLVFNESISSASDFVKSNDNGPVVYEVLRVIGQIPLFYEDHFKRLQNSCKLIGKSIELDQTFVYRQLLELSRLNDFHEGNVMMSVLFTALHYEFLAYFIPHSYPNQSAYENGVEVGFLYAERTNPEAKVIQTSVREAANEMIKSTGVFEVLLVNNDLQLTEGSRSNLFFIRDNILFTAPHDKVLKGITLYKTIEIAESLNIEVRFGPIYMDDLKNMDAVFITGTSPKILPVAKAGNYTYNVKHQMLMRLMLAYDVLIQKDIDQKRRLD